MILLRNLGTAGESLDPLLEMFRDYFEEEKVSPSFAATAAQKEKRDNERKILASGNQAPLPSSAVTRKHTTTEIVDGVERTVVNQTRNEATKAKVDHRVERTRNPSSGHTSVSMLQVAG